MVDCNICYSTYKEEECFTLPNCLHLFCKLCLCEQFKTKIENLNIELADFKCPQCSRIFNPEIIQNFVPPNLFKTYCERALQQNAIYGLEDHELFTNCLNEKCNQKYVIWKDAEYMECPTCRMKFCRKCSLIYHDPKIITCEKQKELHRDVQYLEMKKTLKICRCPKCRNMCEKIQGCNFMYCLCKTNFCFLCDAELTEAYHSSHFQKNDPYNSPCRVWYNGTWVDPDKVPKDNPIQNQPKIVQVEPQKEEALESPCPNCQCKAKNVIQHLYFNKIVKCQSVKCQNKAFCIKCKKQIDLGNLLNHFNSQTNECKFI